MDKRMILLEEVYALHARLVEIYHQPSADNLLLGLFCKKFAELVSVLNPKLTDKQFGYLFRPTINLGDKPELAAHLRAAAQYAASLAERITATPDADIGNETVAVIFDYAQLLRAVSKTYDLPADTFVGSRNTKIDAYTSFKIATQFFWHPKKIQRSNSLNGFTIFALRQSLESAAKELLGIKSICNAQGQPDHYTTQLPWKFLVEFSDKAYFQLPFKPEELQTIYKWTNHFIHTGTDARCYVTALAIKTVEKLFHRKEVTYWPGQSNWVYTNVITNRALLKEDFAQYLAELDPPRFPEWRPDAPLAHFTG